MNAMPKFFVTIKAPGVGQTHYQVEAADSDAAIDLAIQEYVTPVRGTMRHNTRLREEGLASAKISATPIEDPR